MKRNSVYQFLMMNLFTLLMMTVKTNAESQWERLKQSYDLLTTVAGKGGACIDKVNGWLSDYEGQSALEADLSRPHIAMADSTGNLYIADKDAHAIRKIDTKGIITTVAGTSVSGNGGKGIATAQALNSPNGIWVNKKGGFYVLDLGNNKIRKVDSQGNMTTVLHDSSGMSTGRGLWVSKAEDTIWYADSSQIKMWTKSWGLVTYASGFSELGNIVQDPLGYIVATDRSANFVYRIGKQGNKTIIAGNGYTSGGGDGSPALETAFYGVRGVWFLADNTYFLATHEGSQVWYIDSAGVAHLFLDGMAGDRYYFGDGENYQTPGSKVSEVRAVTVDYQGNVIVTENDCGYIRRVAKRSSAVLSRDAVKANMGIHLSTNLSSGVTRLRFSCSNPQKVRLRIYNQHGQIEKAMMTYAITANNHVIQWQNRDLACGMYFVHMQSEQFSFTLKYSLLH